jgi:hypothetical protein
MSKTFFCKNCKRRKQTENNIKLVICSCGYNMYDLNILNCEVLK